MCYTVTYLFTFKLLLHNTPVSNIGNFIGGLTTKTHHTRKKYKDSQANVLVYLAIPSKQYRIRPNITSKGYIYLTKQYR